MLCMNTYARDYVKTCRTQVAAQIASYRQILSAKTAKVDGFEQQFFNHMLLALDHYFMHRARMIEGKDGNPLNEVRMLCNGIMENGGSLAADKTIKYKPETSMLKIAIGDEIRLNVDNFVRLSSAFFDEVEKKFC